jgi:AcrR family transcriptional regulator
MAYHHGNLKRALLAEGVDILQKGEALSLRALAKRVGVTPASVYRHFANKDQLFAALAEEGFIQLEAMFNALPRKDAETLLLDLGEAYVNFALAYPVHFKIMFANQAWNCEGDEVTAQLRKSSDATFVALVAVCAELTRNQPEKHATLIAATWSQVHGFAMLAINGQFGMIESGVRIRDILNITWNQIADRLSTQPDQPDKKIPAVAGIFCKTIC